MCCSFQMQFSKKKINKTKRFVIKISSCLKCNKKMVHFHSNCMRCFNHHALRVCLFLAHSHSIVAKFQFYIYFVFFFSRNFCLISLKETKYVLILIRERQMICKILCEEKTLAITPFKPNRY